MASKKKKEKVDSSTDDGLQFGRVTILQNQEQRTPYVPTIKLLKRDPAEVNAAQSDMGERKPSYKTLQQREAEYAEARRRILGEKEDTEGVENGDAGSIESSPKLAQRFVLSPWPE